jgi:nucleotide-binding universal stress UspA family protein
MYKHILVPTDGSTLSLKAVKEAAPLARALKAKVTALYVMPPYVPRVVGDGYVAPVDTYTAEQYKKLVEAAAAKALKKVEAILAKAKLKCQRVQITGDEPWEAIIKTARSKRCDLIVMSSHGRGGLAGLLLGSETQKVLTHSKTPVLVCR